MIFTHHLRGHNKLGTIQIRFQKYAEIRNAERTFRPRRTESVPCDNPSRPDRKSCLIFRMWGSGLCMSDDNPWRLPENPLLCFRMWAVVCAPKSRTTLTTMITPRGPTENPLSCFRVWGRRSNAVLVGGCRWGDDLGVVVGQSLSTRYEIGPPERRPWTILLSLAQLRS